MVERADAAAFVVLLRNVTKLYNNQWLGWGAPLRAVNRVCLAVKQGDCFGLLGSNGAGKTTLFRMLTHEVHPSGGDISLSGHSVTTDPSHARRCTGYCPQLGGLSDNLTGRELLEFYARLRGVQRAAIDGEVAALLQRLALQEHADLPCGKYSGGNRRKLSVAVALVGSPPVLLLDEPSTGMDPAARRALWVVLQDAQRAGHTIILTSHSMEEVDVLCTSVAILVRGTVCCLGSTQSLKHQYGGGYVLEAKLPRVRHRDLLQRLQLAFAGAEIATTSESWSDVVCLTLLQESLDVPALFEFVERNREDLGIGAYAVSMSSLEHVFMRIVHDADRPM